MVFRARPLFLSLLAFGALASAPALADKHDAEKHDRDARQQAPSAQRPPPRPAPRQRDPLELVMNARFEDIESVLGTPRLDVTEGDARKLQFAGTACVLDVFLYPPEGGGEPRATWVEARRYSDARDVDKGACIKALSGRR